jgi:tripartite-type tricarboxylate transporter receptor subunit TctC
MTFQRGKSGNPDGRPKGARNKTTVAVEALLDGDAEAITRKAIELAKAGDGSALRLCLDRIVPARKDRPVSFGMPKLETAADALKASTAIVEAVACGDLTPSEADELSRVVANFAKVAESADLAERIKRLEQMAENR